MKKLSIYFLGIAFGASLFVTSCKSEVDPARINEMAMHKADSLFSAGRPDIMKMCDADMMHMMSHVKDSVMNAK